MREKKRYVSLLLALSMLVSVFTFNVIAEEYNWDASADGSIKAVLNIDTETLTITGDGAVTKKPWVGYDRYVKNVVINEGITSVPNSLFSDGYVTTVKLPNTLTAISDEMFYRCTNLQEITLPDSLVSIGKESFINCRSLKSITIPETVTSIGYRAFAGCEALENFTYLGKDVDLGKNALGDSIYSASYTIGFKVKDKTAKVDGSQVYLKEALELLGYDVTVEGTLSDDVFASYPKSHIWEVGADNPSDIKLYYNEYTGVLDIIGTGKMMKFSSYGGQSSSPYYTISNIKDVESIIVHEGVESIGANFGWYDGYFEHLSYLSLPDSLTSIGEYAFRNFGQNVHNYAEMTNFMGNEEYTGEVYKYDLNPLVIPKNVKEIGSYAFYGYKGIKSIINLSEENQTIGDDAFRIINVGSDTDYTTTYAYNENTAFLNYVNRYSTAKSNSLDNPILSGELSSGVTWTYEPATKTMTFDGEGDIPDYSNDSEAPWYAATVLYGGVENYNFGEGITSVGDWYIGIGGARFDYNGGGLKYSGGYGAGYLGGYQRRDNLGGFIGEDISINAPSGLQDELSSVLPDATIKDDSGNSGNTGNSGDTGDSGNNGDNDDDKDNTDRNTNPDQTKIIVEAEITNFCVRVPIKVDISFDNKGIATISDDYTVDNKCALGPILIKEINVVSAANWELKAYDTYDFKNAKAGEKYLGLTINSAVVGSNGSLTMNDDLKSVIKHAESKALSFDAKIPAQRTAINGDIASAIVFTVDWDKI